jgi:hypothetical protein
MNTEPSNEPPIRPFFIPEDVKFESLPEPLRLAYKQIVEPAYRQLVLQATTALERSEGLSTVYLLWQEVLVQYEISKTMNLSRPHESANSEDREKRIVRYLRLTNAKHQHSSFLLKLQVMRNKHGAGDVSPGLR